MGVSLAVGEGGQEKTRAESIHLIGTRGLMPRSSWMKAGLEGRGGSAWEAVRRTRLGVRRGSRATVRGAMSGRKDSKRRKRRRMVRRRRMRIRWRMREERRGRGGEGVPMLKAPWKVPLARSCWRTAHMASKVVSPSEQGAATQWTKGIPVARRRGRGERRKKLDVGEDEKWREGPWRMDRICMSRPRAGSPG